MEFKIGNLLRSRAYWLALVSVDDIFKKAGQVQLQHDLPEMYYNVLLKLEDLSCLNRDDLLTLSNKDFAQMLKSGGAVPALALEDGAADFAIEDGDGQIVPAEPVALLALLAPAVPNIVAPDVYKPPIVITEPDGIDHALGSQSSQPSTPLFPIKL